jgi:hypothetical protein
MICRISVFPRASRTLLLAVLAAFPAFQFKQNEKTWWS